MASAGTSTCGAARKRRLGGRTQRVAAQALLAGLFAALPAPAVRAEMSIREDLGDKVSHHVFAGVAIAGFDPVAYLADGRPKAGRPDIERVWNGAAWRFSSIANAQAFESAPQAYAPLFGGYDAQAMRRAIEVAADPAIFAVSDGHLLLFRDVPARESFLAQGDAMREALAGWARLNRAR